MAQQYNGYKLKPDDYQIQAGDVIIRINCSTGTAHKGSIGIAVGNSHVNLPANSYWWTAYSGWRAIETRPGSEANVGDTVYCIKHTCGDCQIHDLFIVNDVKTTFTKFLGPQQGHTLLNKKSTEKDWKWSANDFVILVKASEEISPILDGPSGFYGLAHPLYYVTTKEKVKGINGMLSKAGKIIYPDYGSETFILQCCWKTRAEASIARKNYLKEIASSDITPVDPSEAKPGDYVEWADGTIPTMTNGNYYKVVRANPDKLRVINNLNNEDIWAKTRFKNIIKNQNHQEETTTSFTPFTIVDKKGNEKTCVGLSKNNWYISKDPNGNKTNHNPLFWTKLDHTDKPLDSIEKLLNSTASTTPLTTVSVDSMMNKPTQTKPNIKGKQMNSNLFTDILKLLMQTEQTDLEKAPSTYAFFYNSEGEYEGTARVANEAEAKALLQKPEHLGYTMRIYSFSDEFTTQIPVVSTIKKVSTPVAPKTPKAPRKPKAPKA